MAPSLPQRVYALVEAEKGGLFRSDDGGETWSLASGHRALRQRAWYYSTLTVDPKNPDVVWFPQVPMLKTVDGGKTIKSVKGIHHGDHHDVWIDPANPRRMIARERRRGGRLDRRRRDVVRADAADLAVLPRGHRQRGRRTGSSARCRTSAPRRGPSNSLSYAGHRARRLAHGGRRRGRPRGGRPVRPGRRLRRRVPRHPHPLRPPHAPGAQRLRLAGQPLRATGRPSRATASSGRPRSRSRPTTRRPSTTAATCSSARRTAGRRGRRSAAT